MKKFLLPLAVLAMSLVLKNMLSKVDSTSPDVSKVNLKTFTTSQKVSNLQKNVMNMVNTHKNDIPNKNQTKPKNTKLYDQKELYDFSRSKILEIFPEMQMELYNECEHGYFYKDEDESGGRTCTKILDKYDRTVEQSYYQNKLIHYEWRSRKIKPLTIDFLDNLTPGQFMLMVDGVFLFRVELTDGVVSQFNQNKEGYDNLLFYLGDGEENRYPDEDGISDQNVIWDLKIQFIHEGVGKIARYLAEICIKTRHKKTCDTYNTLAKFKFPPE